MCAQRLKLHPQPSFAMYYRKGIKKRAEARFHSFTRYVRCAGLFSQAHQ